MRRFEYHRAETLEHASRLLTELGDVKYRPCPLLRKMIRAGRLGVKSGRGFFEYDENGDVVKPSEAS